MEHLLCPLKERPSLARFLWGLFYPLQGFQILAWPTEIEQWVTACGWMDDRTDGWKASRKRPQRRSLNPLPNAQVCVYLTVHITKPDMKYKFFKQLSILMVTHWKSNVEIWQSFTIFSPHFWLLKPSKITSFLNFWIFHFTFQRNFSGKNNGIKGLSGRICHRGPNP